MNTEWHAVPIKALISLNPEVVPEDFPSDEEIRYVEISDVSESTGIEWHDPIKFGDAPSRARRRIRNGDVVVSTVRTYLRAVAGVRDAPINAVASTGFAVLRPTKVHPGFLNYAMLSTEVLDQVVAKSMGVSYPAINASDLVSIKVPAPTLKMQRVVSEYLDRETAEIDAFIADQEELIGLLAERRAATISHAVTKGLDPTVPMKDSGIEWIGEIPSAWRATRLSRFFRVTLGKMLDAGKTPPIESTVLPYVRAANIQEQGLDLESVNVMPFTSAESKSLDIRQNDLLVVEGGAIGVNVHIAEDMPGWSFQKTVNRVRPISVADSRFLGFALDALRGVGVIDMLANKSTIAHLTAEKLERIEIAFPPPAEQTVIADYLDAETSTVDAAIADANEAIALSRERRAALISAAVTGKIDVREMGAVA